ncbi:hypothetical protein NC653_030084 [Populus alba x Populus x berolinensis]|uniref:Uncharacterized protein n=1 Tax=Populus alba x Populus x berolinensis TaxID=444605 RepID=A0AAD6LV92_9ROSI|nr:hypothetical protein NC653_030084 [Populus alba x Populus x berolinensis]
MNSKSRKSYGFSSARLRLSVKECSFSNSYVLWIHEAILVFPRFLHTTHKLLAWLGSANIIKMRLESLAQTQQQHTDLSNLSMLNGDKWIILNKDENVAMR